VVGQVRRRAVPSAWDEEAGGVSETPQGAVGQIDAGALRRVFGLGLGEGGRKGHHQAWDWIAMNDFPAFWGLRMSRIAFWTRARDSN